MNKKIKENMSVEIDHQTKLILFKQWGPMTKQTVLDSYELIFCENEFGDDYHAIVDYRDIGEISINAHEIIDIVDEMRAHEEKVKKTALLINDDIGRFALAKLYCALSNSRSKGKVQRGAFNNLPDAEAWINS